MVNLNAKINGHRTEEKPKGLKKAEKGFCVVKNSSNCELSKVTFFKRRDLGSL